jgi:cytochrome P450
MSTKANRDLPRVSRARAFLDSRAMGRNPVAVFEQYRARLGQTFALHFGGLRATVVTTDPVVIEHVLRGGRENYEKSDIQSDRMAEFQGRGLVNSHGAEWLRQRRLLAQGFRPGYLARLFPIQQEVLRDLMRSFDRDVRSGPVDVHKQMVRFTLRLVGKSLFGRSMSDEELEQIGDAITTIQGYILREVVQPYMVPWLRLGGRFAELQRIRRDADAIVLRHIDARLKEGGADADFLRLLLDTPYPDTGQPMGEAQALIESLQLMVAGNETSSNALTWILYLLARHPRYVGEVRKEIATVIGDDAIDYENLHGLKGTMRVIDEALRLYPPFWTIDRVALEDDEIGDVRIRAGTLVMPYIYGTHRNPAHWDDVESFDPARFESQRSKQRHAFAYIPFGAGPRTCIGRNMALVQLLAIIVAVVRRYDFTLASDRPVAIRPMMLLRPGGAVMMTFSDAL